MEANVPSPVLNWPGNPFGKAVAGDGNGSDAPIGRQAFIFAASMDQEDLKTGADDPVEGSDELYQRFVFTADKGQEPYRIDKFLMNRIEGATRNKLQRAINTGLILVNNKEIKQNYKIKAFDQVIVYSDLSPESTEVVPEKMALNIVYEDEDLMIINKPAGMVVHPGSGNYSGTLLNGVAYYLQHADP